ncbi:MULTISPECIES: hypothetical protein [Aeromonas]|nr:hypothetical protein [Aeromonas veronii]
MFKLETTHPILRDMKPTDEVAFVAILQASISSITANQIAARINIGSP